MAVRPAGSVTEFRFGQLKKACEPTLVTPCSITTAVISREYSTHGRVSMVPDSGSKSAIAPVPETVKTPSLSDQVTFSPLFTSGLPQVPETEAPE